MAHTPGPWRLHPDSGVIIVNGSTVYSVKDLTTENEVGGAGDARLDDKRLMAAAPELLAACKELHNCLSDWMEIADSDDCRASDMAAIRLSIAAIAKAERRGGVMHDYAVTISGMEREDGEKPYTYVVTADCYDIAVDYALHAHGPAFGLRLESVEVGLPPANCGYHWNDHRPAWRKAEGRGE